MSLLVTEMTYALEKMIEIQGDTVVLVNKTTLTGANPAPNPFVLVGTLSLSAAALAGAAVISLASSQFLTGRVVPGDTFQIAGDPTTYTVSAQTVSPTTAQTLTDVPFTPDLVQNEAEGAVVSFTFAAVSPAFQALVTDLPGTLIPGETVYTKQHRVRFTTQDIPAGVVPEVGMDLLLGGGTEPTEVVQVSHLEIQGVHYGWALTVRA